MKINLVQASINTCTLRFSTSLDVNKHPKYNYSPHLLYNNQFQSCFLVFKLIEHLSIQKLNSLYFSPSQLNNSLQKVIYMQISRTYECYKAKNSVGGGSVADVTELLSWIIQVCPNCNHKCSGKGGRRAASTSEEKTV